MAGCESEKDPPVAPVKPAINYGDINLNGITYEIADAVLYSNYFVYGRSVFTVDSAKQIAASDVNQDGIPLSVADLVYLTTIINGSALLFPKVTPVEVSYSNNNGVLSVKNNVQIGAALVVLSGNINPLLLADEMDIKFAYDDFNNVTRVLVWPGYNNDFGSNFTGDFLNTQGSDLVSLDMATYEGQPINLTGHELRPLYLFQNNPNPFDSVTSIWFYLEPSGEADLIIMDSLHQTVFKLSKFCFEGFTSIDWNGTDFRGQLLPSGAYFCTVRANLEVRSIQMLLQR
ncbi:MAG: hypothetical protein ACRD5H_08620 [Nitrososphaerales archaeon]